MESKKITYSPEFFPTISVCMIVKNEADNLLKLLPMIEKSVDEIIIVDTGSTDDTLVVAKTFTDKVFSFKWCNDFSIARNESLKYATKDYILWLDADDIMEKQEIMKLKFHLVKNPNTGVFLNLIDNRANQVFRAKQLRVFPNYMGLEFRGKIHEQISFSVEEKGIPYSDAEVYVHHIGYSSEEKIESKLVRNIDMLTEELQKYPDDYILNLYMGKTLIGLGKNEQAKPFIKKCIDLIETQKISINLEHKLLAYIGNSTILLSENDLKKAIEDLKRNENIFIELAVFKLLLGELYFKAKDYENSYKYLIFLVTERKIRQGVIPIDYNMTVNKLMQFLFYSSLYVGDLKTADALAKKAVKDANFRIKGV